MKRLIQAYKRAIEAAETLPGNTGNPGFILQMNLASLHLEEGDLCQRFALATCSRTTMHGRFPPDSPELAGLLNAAGTLYLVEGNL